MLSIYNKISEYIIVVNLEGEIIFCNESFLKRFNYKKDEILNKDIRKIINKFNYFNELSEDNQGIDEILEFYTKSNEVIKVNSNISMENFNNQKSIVIIGEKNEDKPYNMDMLEDLLDNIDVAAFIIDKNGKYLYVNNNFSEMLNEKRENIIDRKSVV